jgi:hypothetical protein
MWGKLFSDRCLRTVVFRELFSDNIRGRIDQPENSTGSLMSGSYAWIWYVLLAGLSWGTYVPLIFFGGTELGGKPNSRFMAILCVGVAYFVIAVLFPLFLYLSGNEQWPVITTNGLVFSGLAGVAGAVGALCVVFASTTAVASAREAGLPLQTYRIYIAPLIFCLAPVVNTLVSLLWHPKEGNWANFGLEHTPSWKLLAGVAMVACGTFLVLYAKEEAEAAKPSAKVAPQQETSQPLNDSPTP